MGKHDAGVAGPRRPERLRSSPPAEPRAPREGLGAFLWGLQGCWDSEIKEGQKGAAGMGDVYCV